MNAYEITCILRPDLDEEHTRAAARQVTDRIETAGGELIASYPWSPARRRMAYEIRDFGDGFYFTATFQLDPPALRPIENALKLNDNVLRFLVVQATEQNIKQSQQRMQQAQAAAAAPPPPPPGAAAPMAPAAATAPANTAEAAAPAAAPEPIAPAVPDETPAPAAETAPELTEETTPETQPAVPALDEAPASPDIDQPVAAAPEIVPEPEPVTASTPATSTTEE